jgi:hypothetical protein
MNVINGLGAAATWSMTQVSSLGNNTISAWNTVVGSTAAIKTGSAVAYAAGKTGSAVAYAAGKTGSAVAYAAGKTAVAAVWTASKTATVAVAVWNALTVAAGFVASKTVLAAGFVATKATAGYAVVAANPAPWVGGAVAVAGLGLSIYVAYKGIAAIVAKVQAYRAAGA